MSGARRWRFGATSVEGHDQRRDVPSPARDMRSRAIRGAAPRFRAGAWSRPAATLRVRACPLALLVHSISLCFLVSYLSLGDFAVIQGESKVVCNPDQAKIFPNAPSQFTLNQAGISFLPSEYFIDGRLKYNYLLASHNDKDVK